MRAARHGRALERHVPSALCVDVCAGLVPFAHLLRLPHRHGADDGARRARRRPLSSRTEKTDRRAPCDPILSHGTHPHDADRILYDRLARALARLAHGALPDELARGGGLHRIHGRHCARSIYHDRALGTDLSLLSELSRARAQHLSCGGGDAHGRAPSCHDHRRRRPYHTHSGVLHRGRLQGRHGLCRADADLRTPPGRAVQLAHHRRREHPHRARARHRHLHHRRIRLARLHAYLHAGLPVRRYAVDGRDDEKPRIYPLSKHLFLVDADRPRPRTRAHREEPVQRQRIFRVRVDSRRCEKNRLQNLLVQQSGALRAV